MARLLINSWELCPKETRAAVLKAITDAFGCEPSVEILASSTDDDLSELVKTLKGLGIAHTSLFRYALAEARKSLVPRGEFSDSRGEFSREDGGGMADGQKTATPGRRSLPIAITLSKEALDDPDAAEKLHAMEQRLKEMRKATPDTLGATLHEKLKERGFAGLVAANAPPAKVLKDLEIKAKQGTHSSTPFFPTDIDKALFPTWSRVEDSAAENGKTKSNKAAKEGSAPNFGGFPAFLAAHLKWGMSTSLIESNPPFGFGDYLNYFFTLLKVAGTNKNGANAAIEYDHLQKLKWGTSFSHNDDDFDLPKEMMTVNRDLVGDALANLLPTTASAQPAADELRDDRPDCRFWMTGQCFKRECDFKHDPAKKFKGTPRVSQSGEVRLRARSRSRDRGQNADDRDRRDRDRRDGNDRRSGDDRQQRSGPPRGARRR